MLKVAAELSVSIGDSPSDDIGKSADSEGVERQMYPDGALFTPTEVRGACWWKAQRWKNQK
jgi:hypothetical protein